MNITVTGASGLIGSRLSQVLAAVGHQVRGMSRRDRPDDALAGADAVVHLAGEPVAQRWTAAARERILKSRTEGTEQLVRAMAALPRRPAALVSASAVGYYGSRGDEILTEESSPGSDFLAQVSLAWERAADLAAGYGIRVAKVRIGVVLSAQGGALPKMLPAFRWFAGGRLGSGEQWMSWIHIDDLAAMIRFLLENPIHGVWNATAPNPVTNAELTRVLAATLHRPAIFPVPATALRLLFGEMSEVLLGSQRALPHAAVGAGFPFAYSRLDAALRHLLSR